MSIEDDGDETSIGAGGSADAEQPTPQWTEACPSVSELGAVDPGALGSCSNEPLDGELTEQNADDILFLLVHEAGHISSLMVGSEEGLYGWTVREDGSFGAQSDNGYATGTFASQPVEGDGESCAVVEFGCWTGGHGGWGPSALAGAVFFQISVEDGVVNRVRIASDSMWLAEAPPLSGTPRTDVSVDVSISDGEVSQVKASIGAYEIEQ